MHQFSPSMVTNEAITRGAPIVWVVFQVGGSGSRQLKIGSWNPMVADPPAGALTGWRNFHDEDRPTPTSAGSLSVQPTTVDVSYRWHEASGTVAAARSCIALGSIVH